LGKKGKKKFRKKKGDRTSRGGGKKKGMVHCDKGNFLPLIDRRGKKVNPRGEKASP